MKLEDALFCVVLTAGSAGPELCAGCAGLMAGGVDMLVLGGSFPGKTARKVRSLCRENDVLCVVQDDLRLAAELEADGVSSSNPEVAIGHLYGAVGGGCFVGYSTRTNSELTLALEVASDFIIHNAAEECVGVFRGLQGKVSAYLYAGGIESPEQAEQIIAGGIYRISVSYDVISKGDHAKSAAVYSRILGRTI